MASKMTTIIVNQTKYGLIITVGTYRRLASVKAGGLYKMQVDVNWTYQEFVLQVDSTDHRNQSMKLSVNSDDCCDYRRITVTEVDGKLDVLREPRRQQSIEANSEHAIPAALVEGATVRPSSHANGIRNLLANSSWKIWH